MIGIRRCKQNLNSFLTRAARFRWRPAPEDPRGVGLQRGDGVEGPPRPRWPRTPPAFLFFFGFWRQQHRCIGNVDPAELLHHLGSTDNNDSISTTGRKFSLPWFMAQRKKMSSMKYFIFSNNLNQTGLRQRRLVSSATSLRLIKLSTHLWIGQSCLNSASYLRRQQQP